MEMILKANGENFTNVINASNVGKKIALESNSKGFTLLKYFKSQPKAYAMEERPLKGNQTQITIKWNDTKQIESYVTAEFRKQFCPSYEVKPHEKKEKKTWKELFFDLLNKCDDEELKTKLQSTFETHETEKQETAKLETAKQALQNLSNEQIAMLKSLGVF